ncbi:hypothetical protein F4809DRAFT_652242 [Biscogniauxia mediterranea]|nr:hypothetical protein F4809DRAFT_652242 [Biscogniauxia mediterranea]
MKYTTALSVALAPLALAKSTHNSYPLRRNGHSKDAGAAIVGGAAVGGAGAAGIAAQLGAIAAVGSTQVIIIWANPGNNAATTTLNQQVTVTQTVTAGATAIASASVAVGAMATHTVTVGGAAGLVYTPAEIQANVGDMVVFNFESMNHTVTQSTFATPCDPMAGGMDSGFQANPNNTVDPPPQVAMQVMTTEPLWFYCKQTGHCGKGMVFSINPTADKTQAMFQAAAIAQKGQGAGSAITGNTTASAAAGAGAAASSAAAAGGAAQASNVLTGAGAIQTGACVCAVTCGAGSFPAVAAQGLGNFGGIAGGLPASMMETV